MASRTHTAIRAKVRDDYLEGNGSCRELAQKYSLSEAAVENWCRREGWRQKRADFDGRVTAKAELSLEKHADALAARQVAVVERAMRDAEAFLDRIEEERSQLERRDVETLRKLISCWQPVVEVQRKSLRLDESEQKPQMVLNLGLLREEPQMAAQPPSGERHNHRSPVSVVEVQCMELVREH